MKFAAADIHFMRTAMELAESGKFTAAPNPLVGCVIVNNDEQIIGQGWHKTYGGPHAEVEAFESIAADHTALLHESTWYITLEPCNHVGKTPACAALIEHIKPKRVVIGIRDFNPEVAGRGLERLRQAGIQVDCGCLANELAWQNRRFCWNTQKNRPWVVLKWATSIDGFMDGRPSEHRLPGSGGFPITSEAAKPLTHTWRALEKGIAVGAGTVTVDEPQLNVRSLKAPSPRVVLLDPECIIRPNHPLLLRDPNAIHVVGTISSNSDPNCCAWQVNEGLDKLLEQLFTNYGLSSLLVEGGAMVLNDFLEQGAWNEIKRWTSPLPTKGGLSAPLLPSDTISLPYGHKSSGQIGMDSWINRLHPRHVFD